MASGFFPNWKKKIVEKKINDFYLIDLWLKSLIFIYSGAWGYAPKVSVLIKI